jgi:peptidylprolyl isomerase
MRLLLSLLFCALVTGVTAQPIPEVQRQIWMLQDQRSLGDGRILAHLMSPEETIRSMAALALANIQDSTTITPLLPLLSDASPQVRGIAAFALGQIGGNAPQDMLVARLGIETDSTVLARIVEALGRIGDERALDAVVEFQPSPNQPAILADRALAVARFALPPRNLKNERSMWFCFDLLNHSDAEVRWRALFALWRAASHGLIDVEISKRREDLQKIANDPSADVRINFATLLGRTRSTDAVDLIRAMLQAEARLGDWRVQVQLARACATFLPNVPELMRDLLGFLESANDHVKIAALQGLMGLPRQTVLGNADSTRLNRAVVRLATTKSPSAELVRGEALVALARLYPEEFNRRNFMKEEGLSIREQTKVIEGMSAIANVRSMVQVMSFLESDTVRVAMAGWDFIRRFLTASTVARLRTEDSDLQEVGTWLYQKALRSLKRGDMAITKLVATALSDTALFQALARYGENDSLVHALIASYQVLSSPDDVEAMQAVVEAMGRIGDERFVPTLGGALKDPDKTVATRAAAVLQQITGKEYSSLIPAATTALTTDYDWPALESIAREQPITILTNKGTVKLRLLRDEAPFTVLSFVRLVKKKFYDGLSFHRVVPNFVVQGGDPRGDGWGGPGYAIRSEFSLRNYARGSVGMASAGKDTEGCQFFLTHLPTPHLDGRYTIFAIVSDGMEVVDRLQVGDTILSITLD